MKIIFWGTRGSLPAPLGARGVRKKLVNALVKSAGRNLDTPEKAEAFCNSELSFSEQGTFGGNTACVQVDTGGSEYLLCDLGQACANSHCRPSSSMGPSSRKPIMC